MTTNITGPRPPAQRDGNGASRSPRRHDPEDRIHVSALVAGLIDSRTCHTHFLDTPGGEELTRWYRRRRSGRRHPR